MIDSPQRIFAAPPGPKPVAVFRKDLLEDRFDDVPNGPLDNTIPHRRYAQRPFLFTPELRYPAAPHRKRNITALPQFPMQLVQLPFQVCSEPLDTLPIDPGAAPI